MSTTGMLQNEKWQNCIDACMRCAESCEYCATCDLQEQDVKMVANCAQINRACACICWTSAQLMSMDSEFSKQVCNLCADICEACAKECERHTNMDHCQQCAQTCRECADECRRMAGSPEKLLYKCDCGKTFNTQNELDEHKKSDASGSSLK